MSTNDNQQQMSVTNDEKIEVQQNSGFIYTYS
jgi:hypothetical protein